jgi:hypothetical protein
MSTLRTGPRESSRFLLRSLAAILPFALAGCLTDNTAHTRPDPLTGLPKTTPTVSSTYNSVSPSTSASLAASSTSASGLGIPNAQPTSNSSPPSSNNWTGAAPSAAPAAGMPAQLGSPLGPTNATASSSPLTSTGPAPALKIKKFEDAEQVLLNHGVNWQKLQMIDGKHWEFACTIPNKANPNVMRNYEATDLYGLTAMQKVIDQIVRDQGQ